MSALGQSQEEPLPNKQVKLTKNPLGIPEGLIFKTDRSLRNEMWINLKVRTLKPEYVIFELQQIEKICWALQLLIIIPVITLTYQLIASTSCSSNNW